MTALSSLLFCIETRSSTTNNHVVLTATVAAIAIALCLLENNDVR